MKPGKNPRSDHIFIYVGHQGKERAYVKALQAAGYKAQTIERIHARFALFDLDVNLRCQILDRLHGRGIPVFIYPHSARPMVQWDGLHPIWPHTKCTFVIAPGHVEVMQRFGYPIPMEIAGWTYCEQKPFKPVREVKRILFGPIHPSASGWVADVDRDLNQRTFKALWDYAQESGASLIVRHIKALELSGLKHIPGVNYIQGKPDLTIDEIDAADIVIGHQTFAYLALARGKPVLMMGEDIPPRTVVHGAVAYVKSWEKYADLLAYPLDILAGDAAEMIAKACKRNTAVAAWYKKFIGEPFDGSAFVKKLENYI
jgi:hypothetical protein